LFFNCANKTKNSLKKKERGLIDVVHAQLLWSATVREKNKKIKKQTIYINKNIKAKCQHVTW
jgi:hypothetical protein